MATGEIPRAGRRGLQIGSLIRALLAFLLAVSAGRLAVYLASWQPPVKYLSVLALLLAVGLIVYGAKWAWRWIRGVSLGRVLLLVLVCYLVAVAVGRLRAPGGVTSADAWREAAIRVPLDAATELYHGAAALLQFPGRMLAEFSGSGAAAMAGEGAGSAETPVPANAPAAPVQIRAISAKGGAAALSLGGSATISGQAARLCQMDAFAVGPFAAGTIVRLVEGPRYITDERWWRVRSDSDTGWCPSSALQL